ncbi:hypothetical protein [Actinoplanes sp. CA-252034]|uniref:hypothetical protein n=1 Tax=Actinoplanes sp. CA-252034 TaxID=3239906 RepID=UPI003D99E6D1
MFDSLADLWAADVLFGVGGVARMAELFMASSVDLARKLTVAWSALRQGVLGSGVYSSVGLPWSFIDLGG